MKDIYSRAAKFTPVILSFLFPGLGNAFLGEKTPATVFLILGLAGWFSLRTLPAIDPMLLPLTLAFEFAVSVAAALAAGKAVGLPKKEIFSYVTASVFLFFILGLGDLYFSFFDIVFYVCLLFFAFYRCRQISPGRAAFARNFLIVYFALVMALYYFTTVDFEYARTGGMSPALVQGDLFVTNKKATDYSVGNVVVVAESADNHDLHVRRLAKIEGEKISVTLVNQSQDASVLELPRSALKGKVLYVAISLDLENWIPRFDRILLPIQ